MSVEYRGSLSVMGSRLMLHIHTYLHSKQLPLIHWLQSHLHDRCRYLEEVRLRGSYCKSKYVNVFVLRSHSRWNQLLYT